jgi:uncharacterized protein
MATKADIEDFVAQPALALVGVSHSGTKFSNMTFKELKEKGYRVFAVNRGGGQWGEETIYPSLSALPEPVGAALVMVKPENALEAVKDCAAQGVKRVWLQQGAQSPEALQYCQENGLRAVSGECILMYAGKSGFHGFHRFFRELFRGKQ